jgi:hypothetical protein
MAFVSLPQESYDYRVAAITDPDVDIRTGAAQRLLSDQFPEGDRIVPSLLRLLARDDIDHEARDTATRSLRVQGYEFGRAPDGRPMALPVEEGRAPIILAD